MQRFSPAIPVPEPSRDQVLWRAGCPPYKAGVSIREKASLAVTGLMSSLSGAWCGAVHFSAAEVPDSFRHLWPELPVSIMAATLGNGTAELVSSAGDLEGFLLDSAASVAVESFMKALQRYLSENLDMEPTRRTAPGYGDMPLFIQKEIIAMFPDSGISCGESYMLSPVKSMTGVTGWVTRGN